MLLGCTTPGAPSGSQFTTNVTFTNGLGEPVTILPAAHVNEQYAAEITPTSGTPPFNCELASGSSLPGQINFVGTSCMLAGMPPALSAGTTHAEYPFSFYIKDASGAKAGPFQLVLEVVPYPPDFILLNYPGPARIEEPYEHDFCSPPSSTPLNCGHDPASNDPSHGVPPYTFTASGLPVGLTMRADGHLSGTIPRGVKDGEQTIEVCVTDSAGTSTCMNAILVILPSLAVEKWTGTLTGQRNYSQESGVCAKGKIGFDYYVEFTVPISFVDVLEGKKTIYYYFDEDLTNGALSGSANIINQAWDGWEGSGCELFGGTVEDVPFHVSASHGGITQGEIAIIHFDQITGTENYACGGRRNYHTSPTYPYPKVPDQHCSNSYYYADPVMLGVTSISNTKITGTWILGSGGYDAPECSINPSASGTFTLTRVS